MKKNIEWLKEAKRDYLREEINSIGSNTVSRINIKINDIIDQLDESETLSKKWIENHTASAYTIAHYSEEDVRVIMVSDLRKLLVPKQELPVIPKSVADLMEDYNDASIQSFLSDAFRNYREGRADRADTWIIKNPAVFVDAYRYGYTVEEKKYYVLNRQGHLLLKRYSDGVDESRLTKTKPSDKAHEIEKFELTEQEIKDYDERYFAFAVPVEELEE